MKLVSMAIKPSTSESLYACAPAPICSPYPYGLRINLSQEQMEALGMTGLPVAGTTVHMEATAVVTRASSEDPDADGDVDYLCVEMQITEMAIEDAADPDEDDDEGEEQDATAISTGRAERMYAKGKQPA